MASLSDGSHTVHHVASNAGREQILSHTEVKRSVQAKPQMVVMPTLHQDAAKLPNTDQTPNVTSSICEGGRMESGIAQCAYEQNIMLQNATHHRAVTNLNKSSSGTIQHYKPVLQKPPDICQSSHRSGIRPPPPLLPRIIDNFGGQQQLSPRPPVFQHRVIAPYTQQFNRGPVPPQQQCFSLGQMGFNINGQAGFALPVSQVQAPYFNTSFVDASAVGRPIAPAIVQSNFPNVGYIHSNCGAPCQGPNIIPNNFNAIAALGMDPHASPMVLQTVPSSVGVFLPQGSLMVAPNPLVLNNECLPTSNVPPNRIASVIPNNTVINDLQKPVLPSFEGLSAAACLTNSQRDATSKHSINYSSTCASSLNLPLVLEGMSVTSMKQLTKPPVSISTASIAPQPPLVTVPFGWKRMLIDNSIVYCSPSGVFLTSVEQVKQYLQTAGTCKCGLECPMIMNKCFNFNPHVLSVPWCPGDSATNDDLTKLCNHKRKLIIMASLQNSVTNTQVQCQSVSLQDTSVHTLGNATQQHCSTYSHSAQSKNKAKTKKARQKQSNPYDGMLVSKLLEQREKMAKVAAAAAASQVASKAQVDSATSIVPSFSTSPLNTSLTSDIISEKSLLENVSSFAQPRSALPTVSFSTNTSFSASEATSFRNSSISHTGNHALNRVNGDSAAIQNLQSSVNPSHVDESSLCKDKISEESGAKVVTELVSKSKRGRKKRKAKLQAKVQRKQQCPNVDVRQLLQETMPIVHTTVSFLENPTAYLAQQTALLNQSMSSQQQRPFTPSCDTKPSAHVSSPTSLPAVLHPHRQSHTNVMTYTDNVCSENDSKTNFTGNSSSVTLVSTECSVSFPASSLLTAAARGAKLAHAHGAVKQSSLKSIVTRLPETNMNELHPVINPRVLLNPDISKYCDCELSNCRDEIGFLCDQESLTCKVECASKTKTSSSLDLAPPVIVTLESKCSRASQNQASFFASSCTTSATNIKNFVSVTTASAMSSPIISTNLTTLAATLSTTTVVTNSIPRVIPALEESQTKNLPVGTTNNTKHAFRSNAMFVQDLQPTEMQSFASDGPVPQSLNMLAQPNSLTMPNNINYPNADYDAINMSGNELSHTLHQNFSLPASGHLSGNLTFNGSQENILSEESFIQQGMCGQQMEGMIPHLMPSQHLSSHNFVPMDCQNFMSEQYLSDTQQRGTKRKQMNNQMADSIAGVLQANSVPSQQVMLVTPQQPAPQPQLGVVQHGLVLSGTVTQQQSQLLPHNILIPNPDSMVQQQQQQVVLCQPTLAPDMQGMMANIQGTPLPQFSQNQSQIPGSDPVAQQNMMIQMLLQALLNANPNLDIQSVLPSLQNIVTQTLGQNSQFGQQLISNAGNFISGMQVNSAAPLIAQQQPLMYGSMQLLQGGTVVPQVDPQQFLQQQQQQHFMQQQQQQNVMYNTGQFMSEDYCLLGAGKDGPQLTPQAMLRQLMIGGSQDPSGPTGTMPPSTQVILANGAAQPVNALNPIPAQNSFTSNTFLVSHQTVIQNIQQPLHNVVVDQGVTASLLSGSTSGFIPQPSNIGVVGVCPSTETPVMTTPAATLSESIKNDKDVVPNRESVSSSLSSDFSESGEVVACDRQSTSRDSGTSSQGDDAGEIGNKVLDGKSQSSDSGLETTPQHIQDDDMLQDNESVVSLNNNVPTDIKLKKVHRKGWSGVIVAGITEVGGRNDDDEDDDDDDANHTSDDGESQSEDDKEDEDHISRAFSVGDVVWGQSHGFPSWPGKLVAKEDVNLNHVKEWQTGNKMVWVKWFGMNSYTQVNPEQLKSLSDGLEAHHRAWQKQRSARKMDSSLEAAIQEAMSELDKRQPPETHLVNIGEDGKVSKRRRVR